MKFLFLVITAVLLSTQVSTQAHAAKFGVKVLSDSGEPMAGIAVCVGTHGNYKRFGAVFTSSSGDAIVDVPNVPLVITISKNRFMAMRLVEPARKFNLIKEVKLRSGIPGPRCRAGSTLVDSSKQDDDTESGGFSLKIDDVFVDNKTFSVSLQTSVTGDPSHYRVSDTGSFSDTDWQAFTAAIDLDRSMIYSENLILQMRKYKTVSAGWVEARSNIVNVEMPKL